MTTVELENETLPPIPCAPWCTDGDGHTGELCREDQNCYSAFGEVAPLTRRPRVHYTDGVWRLDRLEVLLRRGAGDDAVIVVVDETENTELELLPHEAERLAGLLLAHAEKAREQ